MSKLQIAKVHTDETERVVDAVDRVGAAAVNMIVPASLCTFDDYVSKQLILWVLLQLEIYSAVRLDLLFCPIVLL
jgi:hypothetical protein